MAQEIVTKGMEELGAAVALKGTDKILVDNADGSQTATMQQVKEFAKEGLKTSEIQNDSNFVVDPDYQHTDNNFTTEEKQKLEQLQPGGGGSGVTDYSALSNKPAVGGVTLEGNKTPEQLGLQPKMEGTTVATINGTPIPFGGNVNLPGGEGGGAAIIVDKDLNPDSPNAIQNGTVAKKLSELESNFDIKASGTQSADKSVIVTQHISTGTDYIIKVTKLSGEPKYSIISTNNSNTNRIFDSRSNSFNTPIQLKASQDIENFYLFIEGVAEIQLEVLIRGKYSVDETLDERSMRAISNTAVTKKFSDISSQLLFKQPNVILGYDFRNPGGNLEIIPNPKFAYVANLKVTGGDRISFASFKTQTHPCALVEFTDDGTFVDGWGAVIGGRTITLDKRTTNISVLFEILEDYNDDFYVKDKGGAHIIFKPNFGVSVSDEIINTHKEIDSVRALIGSTSSFHAFKRKNDNLANGAYLTLPATHLQKNSTLTALVDGTIEKISVGVGYYTKKELLRDYDARWLEITNTEVKVYSYFTGPEFNLVGTFSHGLTFSNRTTIVIDSKLNGNVHTAYIRIFDGKGKVFEQKLEAPWGVGQPFLLNSGSYAIKVSLQQMPHDLLKSVWIFGDSYFSFNSTERWPYYLAKQGYKDYFCNSQPGSNPSEAYDDLVNLLALGYTPKYLLWCLGMNGDTREQQIDGVYQINDYQKEYLDKVVKICQDYAITLVLATIPTVPERQKTGYNVYVRSLGVRIVEFDKAVGTNSSGQWIEGLLSSDKVHPTVNGAIVLESQVLVDFPEIMTNE